MNLDTARFNMIQQQIRPWNVLDDRVLDALERVPRHLFVADAQRELAYSDVALPLPHGQTMLEPRVQARMVQDSGVRQGDRVLVIGAGSGYVVALAAALGQQVMALELHAALAELAQANLQRAGIRNAEVRHGDGSADLGALGLFDVVLLTGSVAQLPLALRDRLGPGGRLGAVIGSEPIMGFERHERGGHGAGGHAFTSQVLWDAVIPRLANFAEEPAFHF